MVWPVAAAGMSLGSMLSTGASVAGGLGQLAGGLSGLFGGRPSTPDNSTFYQNWRNDDMKNRNEEFAWQQKLATEGIQMRVRDAKAAGVHPLYALGAAPISYSPISVNSQGPGDFGSPGQGPDIGGSLSRMGQGLERALSATMTPSERALNELQKAQLEESKARTELTRAQTASVLSRMGPSQLGPGIPAGMKPGLGVYEPKPPEVLNNAPDKSGITAGPAEGNARWVQAPSGALYSVPSSSLNMDELSSPGYLTWMMNNKVFPYFSQSRRDQARPSKSQLPPGAIGWSLGAGGMWYPVYNDIPDRDRRGHLSDKPHYQFYP